jgi:signal transduction histidine kinase
LDENLALVDRAIEQTRNLSLGLRPPHLSDLGLVATLHWYLRHQSQIANIDAHLEVTPQDLQVPQDQAIVCFRITQEAVTNAIRHSRLKHVEVDLQHFDSKLFLSITDDGIGFDVVEAKKRAASGASMGLFNMQERASLAGGQLDIESTVGQGTTVRATFPLLRAS